MTASKPCDECGTLVTAPSDETFGSAFLIHAREAHSEWSVFPDMAVTNYGEALLRLTGRRERLESIGSVVVEHVTPDRLDDFLSFFDHDAFAGNPAWAACYCVEPHVHPRGVRPDEMEPTTWQQNRARMVELLTDGESYGYLAYVEGRPAGWVNASTRAACALYRAGRCRGPRRDLDLLLRDRAAVPPPRSRRRPSGAGHRRCTVAGCVVDRGVPADRSSCGRCGKLPWPSGVVSASRLRVRG